MLLVDVENHTFARDDEVKVGIAEKRPLEEWLKELVCAFCFLIFVN